LQDALAAGPDVIMLDNMSLADMQKAVQITAGRVPLEASGNVTLETLTGIAQTGVDFISTGAITHSARAVDISMLIEKI
jgi:nicotinate-nucleotide pyrophosphorylase (carboxylating)